MVGWRNTRMPGPGGVPGLWEVGEQNGHARPREARIGGERGPSGLAGRGAGKPRLCRGERSRGRPGGALTRRRAQPRGALGKGVPVPCAPRIAAPRAGMYVGAFLVSVPKIMLTVGGKGQAQEGLHGRLANAKTKLTRKDGLKFTLQRKAVYRGSHGLGGYLTRQRPVSLTEPIVCV